MLSRRVGPMLSRRVGGMLSRRLGGMLSRRVGGMLSRRVASGEHGTPKSCRPTAAPRDGMPPSRFGRHATRVDLGMANGYCVAFFERRRTSSSRRPLAVLGAADQRLRRPVERIAGLDARPAASAICSEYFSDSSKPRYRRPQLLGHGQRRAAAGERVEHQLARVAATPG